MARSKYKWNAYWVWASWCMDYLNKGQIELQQATQWQGQIIGCAGENVSDKFQ
jgi:hypothetical protein